MATKVIGLDRLKRKLAALPGATKATIKAALEQGADEMVAMATNLAPVEDGVLKSTIKKEPGRHELAVAVVAGGAATTKPVRDGSGVDYDYAFAQELGTSHMRASPFFFPAYRAIRKRIRGRVTRATNKAAKDVAGAS